MSERLQQVAPVSELVTNVMFKHFIAIQQLLKFSLWVTYIPQQGRPGCF